MKKERNLIILLLTILFAASCTMGGPGPNDWIQSKNFSGPVVETIDNHGTKTVKEIPMMFIQFDSNAKCAQYDMQAKDKLEYKYLESTYMIHGIVTNSDGHEFVLDVSIKSLPKRQIEYKETMYSVKDNQYRRIIEGILNEMM